MKLELLDLIVILLYFLAVIAIGFYSKNKKIKLTNSTFDFVLDGRRLTLPLFVATLVATWYGLILGIGEFVYSQGIVAWVCLGIPYYVTAIVYAFFITNKIRTSKAVSIPEQIALKYGKSSGKLASVLVLLLTIPAAYILMVGTVLQMITSYNFTICIIIGTFLSVVYLFKGGFRADVLTNALQFVLMFVGFGVLFIFSVIKYGNLFTLIKEVPPTHLSIGNGNSYQVIIVWFIISLQTFIDPSFHQRSAAAKTVSIARKGIIVSVLFWMLFDFLTITTGLYARAHLQIEPIMAYPALAEEILPVFWKGIFVVSLLATIMSSLNSYTFLSAVTIGKELLSDLYKNKKSDVFLIRFGLIVTSIIGILLAMFLPSAVQLIYKSASIAVPGLLIPLLESYSTKKVLSSVQAMWLIGTSSLISGIWLFLSYITIETTSIQNLVTSVEPMIPGMLLSLLVYLYFLIKFKRIQSKLNS